MRGSAMRRCCPLVGKYKDNKIQYQGKTYEMSQHGFCTGYGICTGVKEKDSIVMNLTDTKETLEKYPFHFELQCSFTLKGSSIEAGWKVINSDVETMYFSIGGHPAFNVPILPDTKREDYHLTFSGQKELTYHLLDTRYGTAIPEKSYTLALENGSCQIAEGMLIKMR